MYAYSTQMSLYVCMYIYILRLRPCRRPLQQSVVSRFAVRLIEKMQIGRIEIIGKFSNCIYLFKQISFILFHRFIDFSRSWGTSFQAFWVLGHHFFIIWVIIGCKGAFRRDQNRFSAIWGGFWVSHWRPFWITFSYFL